jgi:acid phosphatase type 7
MKRLGLPALGIIGIVTTIVLWRQTAKGNLTSTMPAAGASGFSRGPYPQMATPTGITLVWRTRRLMLPEVRVDTVPKSTTIILPGDKIIVRREDGDETSPDTRPLHSAPPGTFQFEATLTGLASGTTYTYGIYDNGKCVTPSDTTCSFQTLPTPGTDVPFSFWVVGDSGNASDSQRKVHEAFLNWQKINKTKVNFYVHVGDMAYNKGLDSEFQYGFFDIYGPTLRGLTCWPTMGNHEGYTSKGGSGIGPYYDAYITPTKGESGGLPSGVEGYYSWDYGQTHFICLNSHDEDRDATGTMATWLKADLEKTKANWIIAYWHHPQYTKGSHNSDKEKDLIEMRENIVPICESGGVDLILCGHSHVYERSFLIDGAYATPTVAENAVLDDRDGDPKGNGPYRKRPGNEANDGTIHIVAGHGGQALSRKDEPSPIMRKTIVEFGSVIVEVNGNTLTSTMINASGRAKDRVQIVKDSTKPPTRIAKPRKPENPDGPTRLRAARPSTGDDNE